MRNCVTQLKDEGTQKLGPTTCKNQVFIEGPDIRCGEPPSIRERD
jgi:hypothetical protein